MLYRFDAWFIEWLRRYGITLLRYSVAVVFIWFGALKIFGHSPVGYIIGDTYRFMPFRQFMLALGIWEVLVGIGLATKLFLRVTLALFWLQMFGTLCAVIFNPDLFFTGGNPLLLTVEGEFLIKNLTLITAGMVIGGHEVRARQRS